MGPAELHHVLTHAITWDARFYHMQLSYSDINIGFLM